MADIDCVLLVSFGGPEGPDDVMPFLRNVTRGRGIPDERLAAVARHYDSFGGVSPINEHNRALLIALRHELDSRGIDLPLHWGNRHWEPYVADAVEEISAANFKHPFVITTSAYSSQSGCRQYRECIEDALGAFPGVEYDKAPAYFDREGFIAPFADGLVRAIDALLVQGIEPAQTAVLFTTHSIPIAMAEASGPSGGAYVAQHQQVATRVAADAAAQIGSERIPQWSLVYQSRSGAPHIPWLEPDVNAALRSLPDGVRAAIIVPIGFVSDHLEVVWDLDNEARATCKELGLVMMRVETPGVDPRFVAALADLVVERRDGAVSKCPRGCCLPG